MEILRVLVTDDEPGMRLGVRRVLNDFRIDVPDVDTAAQLVMEEADCGEKALDLIAARPPDILVLDHKMPGISGLEVLAQVRNMPADILTIMITAYASIETAVQAVKQGAYDFLAKPFTPDELRNTVKKAAVRIVLAKQARRLADERHQVRLQLMRTLSHELQAPLSAVDGYLELLQAQPYGSQMAAYGEVLQRAQERVDGMRRLVHDLLNMTTVESSARARQPVPVDVVPVARTAIHTLEALARQQQVTVTFHRSEPIWLGAVPDELRMVLENLVSNAIKYNRPGGQVHVTIDRTGDTVSIGVADTGWGIESTELDRLGQEFVRIRTDQTRHVSGTGLGLSIVKRIARLYQGDLLVDSEPGVGSKFTVLLQDPTPQELPTAASATPETQHA